MISSVHDFIGPEIYRAAVRATREYEMALAGHVPFTVGLAEVIAAGQHSIEHLSGFSAYIQKPNSPFRGRISWHDRIKAFGHLDETRIEPVAISIRDAGIWSCPTLVSAERLVPGALARKWLRKSEINLLHSPYRKQWQRIGQKTMGQKWDSAAAGHANRMRLRIVGALHRAGARLLLGTDAMAPFVVPGFTIHDELANLVKAGLTPFEALRAGTSDAGEFLGQSFGLIAPGQRADLLLLSADPLESTANTRRIAGVMTRGRWIPQRDMQGLFQEREKVMAQELPKHRRR